MIFINFKSYKKTVGEKAVFLAKLCKKYYSKSLPIIPAVQTTDLYRLSKTVKIPLWAQHIDPVKPNRATGFVSALAVKKAGAQGVFLNHSEHPIKFSDIKFSLTQTKIYKLKVLVFVKNIFWAKKVDQLKPDLIALEEPSLVSGDKAMVKDEKLKKEIKKFAESVKATPIVGAGIKNKRDVSESLKLGVKGIALASGIVKASNPEEVLKDLIRGFK